MTCKKPLVVVVLLSVILGVDARSPRKTEKLYRKAGKWQRKLRDVWALLGVKPFLVQPGEEGDECVLKSKVEEDYVLKGADVFTQADLDEALQTAALQAETEKQAALAAKDDEIAANYKSNAVVEANYVLKTCGSPPAGKQFKAGLDEDTTCGDPTGQTDCATKCFEDLVGKPTGSMCNQDQDCASGSCEMDLSDFLYLDKCA